MLHPLGGTLDVVIARSHAAVQYALDLWGWKQIRVSFPRQTFCISTGTVQASNGVMIPHVDHLLGEGYEERMLRTARIAAEYTVFCNDKAVVLFYEIPPAAPTYAETLFHREWQAAMDEAQERARIVLEIDIRKALEYAQNTVALILAFAAQDWMNKGEMEDPLLTPFCLERARGKWGGHLFDERYSNVLATPSVSTWSALLRHITWWRAPAAP